MNGTGNSALVGYYVRQYGNPSTSWEANNTFNIGADATLFNNKLDIVVDYYTKNVKGLLFTPPSYALAGEGRPPAVNIGDIQNKGIDLGITYRTRVNKDLDISIGANFGTYTNKITKLPLPGYFDDGSFRFAEGQSISSFFGYKVIGLFQSAEDVDKSPGQDAAAPGRLKYLDANGDDSITTADRVFYGSGIPAFTLGINLGVNWRNIDFSAQIYTVQGVDIYNGLNTQLMSFENGVTNKSRKLLNAWTPSNTNTNIKKNESGSNFSNSAVNNSNFLEDGSFVRLRSIMIGYSFQGAGLRAIGLNRLRVYLQGANLITISKYSGLDPEVVPPSTATKGLDAGAYVQSPGVVFGLNLTF